MRALRSVVSVAGVTLALGDVAAASVGYYDSGHLAVMAVVGGAVALGSSALGGYLGGSTSAPKRGVVVARETTPVAPKTEVARPAAESAPISPIHETVADHVADLAGDAAGSERVGPAYDLAKNLVTGESVPAGAAEGLTDVAVGRVEQSVRAGVKEGLAAPSGPAGTVARFCPDCGTPAREGGRFCASCGRKLG